MVDDSYSITVAEGGFIVNVSKHPSDESPGSTVLGDYSTRVFPDSSTLLNYLHNELVGSN